MASCGLASRSLTVRNKASSLSLKNEAYAVLEKLNITPTEAVRLLFQYVAENGRMPW